VAALTGGYQVAFLVGAIFALAAAVIGVTLLRPKPVPVAGHEPGAELATAAD
jgi:hypothetical protein